MISQDTIVVCLVCGWQGSLWQCKPSPYSVAQCLECAATVTLDDLVQPDFIVKEKQ